MSSKQKIWNLREAPHFTRGAVSFTRCEMRLCMFVMHRHKISYQVAAISKRRMMLQPPLQNYCVPDSKLYSVEIGTALQCLHSIGLGKCKDISVARPYVVSRKKLSPLDRITQIRESDVDWFIPYFLRSEKGSEN